MHSFFPEIPDAITVRNPPPSRRDLHTRGHPNERRRWKQKRRQESLQSRANFSGASWLYKLHTHWGSHCWAVLHIKLVSYWRYCWEGWLMLRIWDLWNVLLSSYLCWWLIQSHLVVAFAFFAPKFWGGTRKDIVSVCECSLRSEYTDRWWEYFRFNCYNQL